MMLMHRAVSIQLIIVTGVVLCSVNAPSAYSQNTPINADGNIISLSLMQNMVGTWNVQQRMWPGYGAEPTKLPSAVAHRRLVEGAFLEEVMELEPGSSQKPFTRTAYFNGIGFLCIGANSMLA
jgi:hypothetical protein